MKLIKTENQKLYLSKFCQDMSKAVFDYNGYRSVSR